MADTTQKRALLKKQLLAEYDKRVANAKDIVAFSLGEEALNLVLDFMLDHPKGATRTKTFRFPSNLLAWLEDEAANMSRSPNAHLIELLQGEMNKAKQ